MTTETDVLNRIRLALDDQGVVSFRNNVGAFYDEDGRLVRYGLYPGSSDLICITPYTVTEADIGRLVGIFTAIEVKRRPGIKPTKEQGRFIKRVIQLGGIGGVAGSQAEAIDILRLAGVGE